MTKKHQCDFCKKVKICINAIPSRIEHKQNKKQRRYNGDLEILQEAINILIKEIEGDQ